jgi:hypothetical protein
MFNSVHETNKSDSFLQHMVDILEGARGKGEAAKPLAEQLVLTMYGTINQTDVAAVKDAESALKFKACRIDGTPRHELHNIKFKPTMR